MFNVYAMKVVNDLKISVFILVYVVQYTWNTSISIKSVDITSNATYTAPPNGFSHETKKMISLQLFSVDFVLNLIIK